jgi:hypothetical protein
MKTDVYQSNSNQQANSETEQQWVERGREIFLNNNIDLNK